MKPQTGHCSAPDLIILCQKLVSVSCLYKAITDSYQLIYRYH